jgi:hypothetical protein
MAIYMIGYDLHPANGPDYDDLFAALEEIGSGYWDCLESTWLVTADKTPAQIRDELKKHLKEGDRLLVLSCGAEAAWLGFKDQCQTWLEDNFALASPPT